MSTEMRVLTVRQPWAWAIIHGGKDVENRVRNIAGSYRGPVAIHVALRDDTNAFSDFDPSPCLSALDSMADGWYEATHAALGSPPWWGQQGHIIGVVDLVDVHTSHYCFEQSINYAAQLYGEDREAFDDLPVTNGAGGLIGRAAHCSAWAESDVHHLVLANPRPLAEPIPYKGALGLRRLPDDVVQQVLEGTP